MNDNIKKFVNYEHPTMSHRYLISITFILIIIFFPMIFLFSYKARWLFYMLIPGGIMLFLWAVLLFVNPKHKRRNYYNFSSVSKIYISFVFLNVSYAAITTVLNVPIILYISLCVCIGISFICFLKTSKREIESGKKKVFKQAKPLSIGALFLITIISKAISQLLAETFSNIFVILLAFSLFVFLTFIFVFFAARECLKSQYIKQIEEKQFD